MRARTSGRDCLDQAAEPNCVRASRSSASMPRRARNSMSRRETMRGVSDVMPP